MNGTVAIVGKHFEYSLIKSIFSFSVSLLNVKSQTPLTPGADTEGLKYRSMFDYLASYLLVNRFLYAFKNLKARCDSKSIFKQSTADLNSVFSFF